MSISGSESSSSSEDGPLSAKAVKANKRVVAALKSMLKKPSIRQKTPKEYRDEITQLKVDNFRLRAKLKISERGKSIAEGDVSTYKRAYSQEGESVRAFKRARNILQVKLMAKNKEIDGCQAEIAKLKSKISELLKSISDREEEYKTVVSELQIANGLQNQALVKMVVSQNLILRKMLTPSQLDPTVSLTRLLQRDEIHSNVPRAQEDLRFSSATPHYMPAFNQRIQETSSNSQPPSEENVDKNVSHSNEKRVCQKSPSQFKRP